MKRGTLLLALGLVIVAAVAWARGAGPDAAAAATASANAWLALVDQGQYGESWDAAATYFRVAVPRDKWAQSAGAVRGPLGTVLSRKLKSAKPTTTLPGAPDGKYVVIQFATSFANKKKAIETVTPMQEPDGSWKVSGYFIK